MSRQGKTADNIMKKLWLATMLAFFALAFSGCDHESQQQSKQYSVNISGYENNIAILEYNDIGDIIYNHYEKFATGQTKNFTSQPNTSKVKIHVQVTSVSGNINGYVQQVFYLTPGQTTKIVINNTTLIGPNEP